jgi:hypothetical protein
MPRRCARCGRSNGALFESPAGDRRCQGCLKFAGQGAQPDLSLPSQAEPPGPRQGGAELGEGAMTERTDAEMLAKVTEELQILEVQLASAEATEAAAGQRLAGAEPRLAEPRQSTETFSVIGVIPMNGGGYRYSATPPSASARRLDRMQKAFEAARREAQVASSVVFAIRLNRDRLRRAQRTIQERLGAAG